MTTILITGASGNTGRALLDELGGADVQIRAMVRGSDDYRAPEGVRPVVADFDDAGSIARALDGVDRAYLVTPSSERAEDQQLRFVEAARQAGVQRLVVLSQLAADKDSPVRFLRYHAVVENRVRELGTEYVFLRPNLYFQGLFAFAGAIKEFGRFGAPIGDARVSAVDVRDIAAVAAVALTTDEPQHATFTITGPAAITHEQMAEALTAATGHPVEFGNVEPHEFAQQLQGILPPWQIDGLLEDYAHYARGEAASVTDVVRDVTGRQPRSFAEFARDNAAAFGGASST